MTDKRTIPDDDAALILELAARIDEYIFADGDVFATVSVEGKVYVDYRT